MDRDQQLIAYLDARFANIDARFEGIDAKFEGVDHRFDEMQSQMDGRFEAMQQQMDGRFEQMQQQVDGRFDETREQIRHSHVAIEDLHSRVQAIAEGYVALDEKVDRHHREVAASRREDRSHIEALMQAMYIKLSRRDDELEELCLAR